MKGIFINSYAGSIIVNFNTPDEVFRSDFTIVGACPENDLIMIGSIDAQKDKSIPCNLSEDVLKAWNYDEVPRGDLLITKNDEKGELVDVTDEDLHFVQNKTCTL